MNDKTITELPFLTCFHGAYEAEELQGNDDLFFDTIFASKKVANFVAVGKSPINGGEGTLTLLTIFSDESPLVNPNAKILKIQCAIPPYDDEGKSSGRALVYDLIVNAAEKTVMLIENPIDENRIIDLNTMLGKFRLAQISELLAKITSPELSKFNVSGRTKEDGDFDMRSNLDETQSASLLANAASWLEPLQSLVQRSDPPEFPIM